MSQEFLDLSQLNNLFGADQVQETFGTPQETFTTDDSNNPAPASTPDDDAAKLLNLEAKPEHPTSTETIVEAPMVIGSGSLNSVVSSLVKSGEWEDVALKLGDKEYNNLEELMNDKSVDIDLFNEILESQKELKKEKISSTYLKLDDPDGINANLAKAILQGQDYSELLAEKEQTIDPIAQLDFSFVPNDAKDMQRAENEAANLLLWYHENTLGYNLQDEFVRKAVYEKIQNLKDNFELLDTAESVKTHVVNQYNEDLRTRFKTTEALKNQQLQEKKQEIKVFKDNLKAKGYADNFVKDVISLKYDLDNATSTPQYLSIIKNRVESDPEFATEILHFILDKDGYLNTQKLPEKLETQRRMIEISGKAKKSSIQQSTADQGQARTAEEEKLFKLFG